MVQFKERTLKFIVFFYILTSPVPPVCFILIHALLLLLAHLHSLTLLEMLGSLIAVDRTIITFHTSKQQTDILSDAFPSEEITLIVWKTQGLRCVWVIPQAYLRRVKWNEQTLESFLLPGFKIDMVLWPKWS